VNLGTKRIQYKEDCHLVMLQHWSLADALFNSPYVATRLRTWKESGKEKIELMLAKMGFPLVECQQHWTHMSPKLKQKLSSKLEECAPQFGLVNFQFASFQREDGYTSISSSDMVHAITALLEVGFYDAAEAGRDGDENHFNGVESFWAAYESLAGKKKDLVQKGLELAMLLQKVIVNVGGAQLNRRTVYQCGHFRYLNLDEAGLGENATLLAHPLVLERLAFFLQEAHAHMGRKHKPVVIVGPKLGEKVLVVGVTGSTKPGQKEGNFFSNKFKKASKGIGAQHEASGFESNVIKMPHLDVQQFMDELITDIG
jgi:cell division control protein 45